MVASIAAAEIVEIVFIILTSVVFRSDRRGELRVESNRFLVPRTRAALMELVRSIKAIGYRGMIKSDGSRTDRAAFAGEAERRTICNQGDIIDFVKRNRLKVTLPIRMLRV